MKAIFDTNILIDYLNGVKAAEKELDRFPTKLISVITYIELMVGFSDLDVINEIKIFLNDFNIVMVNTKIADLTILARKEHKLKIPDALILATAQSMDALLITRNTKDFSDSIPCVRVPYKLA